jgi:hypothetical protein
MNRAFSPYRCSFAPPETQADGLGWYGAQIRCWVFAASRAQRRRRMVIPAQAIHHAQIFGPSTLNFFAILSAVSQLLWSQKGREEWFSLRENHERRRGFGLYQLRNRSGRQCGPLLFFFRHGGEDRERGAVALHRKQEFERGADDLAQQIAKQHQLFTAADIVGAQGHK